MNEYAKVTKNNLEKVIEKVELNSALYLKNPEKDFTRKRKLSFKEVIYILLGLGGKNLNQELLEYFSYDTKLPTTSAFIQQRGKILPVRKGRKDPRKVKTKSSVSFLYRVA